MYTGGYSIAKQYLRAYAHTRGEAVARLNLDRFAKLCQTGFAIAKGFREATRRALTLRVRKGVVNMAIKATLNEANDKLEISLPVEPRKSASGKTLVLASTRGNIRTGIEYKGREVMLGVNAYVFPKADKAE